MYSLKTYPFGVVLVRLLVAGLGVLLLGALMATPALASGSGTWTRTGSLHVARADFTATLLPNGQVLVGGGYWVDETSYTPVPLASAELFNPVTGAWTTTGNLHTARVQHTATLLQNGQVLVTGGQDNNYNFLASAELYTP